MASVSKLLRFPDLGLMCERFALGHGVSRLPDVEQNPLRGL